MSAPFNHPRSFCINTRSHVNFWSMLQYYIERHGSMRDRLVQHRRVLQPHQLINLNRELSVLTRTSIVASQRTAPRTPFLTMNPPSKDTDTIKRFEAHYARTKFVNVTLARFTNKCQVVLRQTYLSIYLELVYSIPPNRGN